MSTFSFQDLDGEILKGTPDFQILEEALRRFNDARQAMHGQKLDILEFPFSTGKQVRQNQDNIFIRYYKEEEKYEIKIFQFGHYNARTLLGHFMLRKPKEETKYEMTVD